MGHKPPDYSFLVHECVCVRVYLQRIYEYECIYVMLLQRKNLFELFIKKLLLLLCTTTNYTAKSRFRCRMVIAVNSDIKALILRWYWHFMLATAAADSTTLFVVIVCRWCTSYLLLLLLTVLLLLLSSMSSLCALSLSHIISPGCLYFHKKKKNNMHLWVHNKMHRPKMNSMSISSLSNIQH